MKFLLSLVIGVACTATGVGAGVGSAFCVLRDCNVSDRQPTLEA